MFRLLNFNIMKTEMFITEGAFGNLMAKLDRIEAMLLKLADETETVSGEPLLVHRITLLGETLADYPDRGPHFGSVQAIMLPSGEIRTLSRDRDEDLMHKVIGSFGQLGIITRARLQMKKVHSGFIEARAVASPDLGDLLRKIDDAKDQWEYVVGWLDAFPGG